MQIEQSTDQNENRNSLADSSDDREKNFKKNRLLSLLKQDLNILFNDTFTQFVSFYVREVTMTLEALYTKRYNFECMFLINAIFSEFAFACFGDIEIRRCENEKCARLFTVPSARKKKYCCEECRDKVSKRKYAKKRRLEKREEAQKKNEEKKLQID